MAVDLNADLDRPTASGQVQQRSHKRSPNWNKLVPLAYAPALPLLRIGLNKRVSPATRDLVFFGAVISALLHAGYVMTGDSSMGAGN